MSAEPWSFKSSNLNVGQYDPDTREMLIVFHSGNQATYHDVPPEAWADLKAAPSAGKHFHQHIKGKYGG